jgi:O-succinylbenzoic acid--CoA ligase
VNQLSGYPFDSIVLNGRTVKLSRLAEEKARTSFEAETLAFLTAWLGGEEFFRQQTSGSTGQPKRIALSRKQLVASAQRTMSQLPVRKNDTALVCLDTRYIAGKMMLVRALTHNLRIVAAEPSANPLSRLAEKVDFVAVVPYQMSRMLSESLYEAQHINTILIGGGPVTGQIASALRNLPNAVYATYGMTETASNIALQRLSGPHPDKAFRLLPGIKVYSNKQGCLVIDVPELAEPVVTNDVAELYADGTFRIIGRIDNVINSGGIKIFPEETETIAAVIFEQLGIASEFIIGGLPHPELGQQAVLVMEGPPLEHDAEQLLVLRLKEKLSTSAPRNIYYLPAFKRTPNGKVMRRETLMMLGGG